MNIFERVFNWAHVLVILAFLVYLGVEVVSANAVGVASVLRRKP